MAVKELSCSSGCLFKIWSIRDRRRPIKSCFQRTIAGGKACYCGCLRFG
jgi:hypothetical protein